MTHVQTPLVDISSKLSQETLISKLFSIEYFLFDSNNAKTFKINLFKVKSRPSRYEKPLNSAKIVILKPYSMKSFLFNSDYAVMFKSTFFKIKLSLLSVKTSENIAKIVIFQTILNQILSF